MAEVTLTKMHLKDVKCMVAWGKHADPRFFHYNFPYTTDYAMYLWYKRKRKIFRKDIYAIWNEKGHMVGFITLKNINCINKSAEMGISLDPNHLSEGYGTAGLLLYLNEVFTKKSIERIWLRTAEFNKRAIASYEKCGFKLKEIKFMPYEEQHFKNDIVKAYPNISMVEDEIYTNYYFMEIDKAAFLGKNTNNT